MKINDQDGGEINKIIKKSMDNLGKKVSFGQVCVNKNQYINLDPRINMVVCGVDCGILLNGAKKALEGFL